MKVVQYLRAKCDWHNNAVTLQNQAILNRKVFSTVPKAAKRSRQILL